MNRCFQARNAGVRQRKKVVYTCVRTRARIGLYMHHFLFLTINLPAEDRRVRRCEPLYGDAGEAYRIRA